MTKTKRKHWLQVRLNEKQKKKVEDDAKKMTLDKTSYTKLKLNLLELE